MYEQDTFFNLSILGQIGLALLSLFLSAALCLLFYQVTKHFKWHLKIITALLFLWLFMWFSPQIYYTYYMLLFDFLEPQIVVQKPPTPKLIFQTITFTGDTTLSAHSKGILFWCMIAIGFLGNKQTKA